MIQNGSPNTEEEHVIFNMTIKLYGALNIQNGKQREQIIFNIQGARNEKKKMKFKSILLFS